jgi:hypothetical protein
MTVVPFPGAPSPSGHLMCLVQGDGEVLGFLSKNWAQPPALLTNDPADAWNCMMYADGAGFTMAMNLFYGSALDAGARFELRARTQCPSVDQLRHG